MAKTVAGKWRAIPVAPTEFEAKTGQACHEVEFGGPRVTGSERMKPKITVRGENDVRGIDTLADLVMNGGVEPHMTGRDGPGVQELTLAEAGQVGNRDFDNKPPFGR